MKTIIKIIIAAFTILGFTSSFGQNSQNIKLAENAMNALFSEYNETKVKLYLEENYIQHNPQVPTGRQAILGFLPVLKEHGTTYTTHRIFSDGDFVVLHNTYTNAQPFGNKELVAFDIWKINDGKIVEHWDAVTPVVSKTANGRTQVDGVTELTDLDKTEENKTLVKELVTNVFINGKSDIITNYISTKQYDQHNPMVKDGLTGLQEAIAYLSSQNNMFKYHKIHTILGQGNFVLAVVEGTWNQKPYVFYDLFRVKNGKIVEHWDVVNEIPTQMAHKNGLFNF